MNKHLVGDLGVDPVCHADDLEELVASHRFVLLVRVDHVDKAAARLEGLDVRGVGIL